MERWHAQAPDRFKLLVGDELATKHVDTYATSDIPHYVRVHADIPILTRARQRAKAAAAAASPALAAEVDSQLVQVGGSTHSRCFVRKDLGSQPELPPRRKSRGKLRGAGDALLLAEIRDRMQAAMLLKDLEIQVRSQRGEF